MENIVMTGAAHGDMLTDFTQKAVLKNPEVLARWHALKAATEEIGVARGAFFPRLDLSSASGREKLLSPPASYEPAIGSSFSRSATSLTLSQMLYDGFATRDEVRRLDHAQLTRYYELLDSTEVAALETVRSYYDLLRVRKLYALTEDNFVYHRTVFEQIQNKVKAGVGRRVDLEQAAGRLALSESNLVTDNANIHDVSARFQRLVGELPPKEMPKPASLAKLIPANAAEAHLSTGIDFHPAILASVENVRSTQFDLDQRRAKYQPRIDFRLSQTDGRNSGGIIGRNSDTVAEFVLNWNLFNGGSDRARTSQFAERLNNARDLRDKTCRDIRQNLAIAYNDVWKLTEQIRFLEQHQLSIEKARGAYQKQFDIGQRSLLDLLDTENELYQAKRAYTNAEHDLAIAYARTLAGMGKLVKSLELSRLQAADLPDMLGTMADAPETCPPEAPAAMNIPKAELIARAIEAAKPPAAPPGTPGADQELPTEIARSPKEMVERWVQDWSEKNVDAYLAHYGATFLPEKGKPRPAWEAERRRRIEEAPAIVIELSNMNITQPANDKAIVTFTETLSVGSYRKISEKLLELILDGLEWKIQEEKIGSSRTLR